MKNSKHILFVDASYHPDGSYHVSLYDTVSNGSEVLKFCTLKNIQEAEKYGILNAIIYTAKHKLEKVVICCDNENSTKDSKLNSLANKLNARIIWVPREINKVADKIAKLEPTTKNSDKNLLEFLGSTLL